MAKTHRTVKKRSTFRRRGAKALRLSATPNKQQRIKGYVK